MRSIFVDNDVLVFASERGYTSLGALALSEIRAGRSYVTPNQFREFLNVKTVAQRKARRLFLERENIELFGGLRAGQIAASPVFQAVFTAVAQRAGRADAALVAFSKETGLEAVTAKPHSLTH